MNIANKLTVLRVILVPFFVVTLLVDTIPYHYAFALFFFAVASITDALDGNIARKQNLVTNFGKFLDPLADKVLVVSALICFIQLGFVPSWVVVIIIAREFMVTSIRLVAASSEKKTVIAASIWGKLKTISQMVGIVVILIMQVFSSFIPADFPTILIGEILMYIACAMTVISGAQYVWDYRSAIDTNI